MLVFALGCGPGSGSAVDDGSATSSADDGSATSSADDGGSAASSAGGSGSGDGTGGECPPNAVYATPGCGDDEVGPGFVPLPGPGCYEVCDEGDSSVCSEGACVRTWIDPCGSSMDGDTCAACGAESWLCIPGAPLMPGFEASLTPAGGCGLGTFSVAAGNEAGDLMLQVSVGGGLIEAAQTTQMTQAETFTLPSEEAEVRVSLGPNVLANHCNDAPFGTELRRYEGTAGTVEVTVEPPPMGAGSEDQGVVTVVLTEIELQQSTGGEVIVLPSFTFESVSIWCCPG